MLNQENHYIYLSYCFYEQLEVIKFGKSKNPIIGNHGKYY